MADFQKVYLRVVGRVGDTAGDPDKLPDRVMATGQIFLKPNVKDGWAEQTTGPDGIDELMLPAPITCTIEDGMMTYNGDPFVWLVVGEENWNWNISFPQVRIAGVVRKIDSFNFDIEPATEEQIDDEDYQGVNLALLQEFTDPDTGNKAVRGPRGYSIDGLTLVGSDKLRPSLDDPLNTSLPDITIPAISAANTSASAAAASASAAAGSASAASTSATAASGSATAAAGSASAAAASVASFDLDAGTVTTGAPGSGASVNITGGPHFIADFVIPRGDVGPTGPPAPDADATTKGIVQLAGDLSGTAAAPVIGSKKVTAAKIADDTITAAQIAADAITSSELADNAVDTNALGSKVVTAAKIADDTITAAQIAANAVGSSELADNAVDTAAIQDGAVTSAKIADGTIVNADVSTSAAIAANKTLVPASFPYISHGSTRATGVGDLPAGLPFFENFTITQIIYIFGAADASGSTTVKLQRNRAGTTVDIVGSSQTITAANQADGTSTDAARTFTISDPTGTIQSGDRILVNITAVGTTPGKMIGVWLRGYYN